MWAFEFKGNGFGGAGLGCGVQGERRRASWAILGRRRPAVASRETGRRGQACVVLGRSGGQDSSGAVLGSPRLRSTAASRKTAAADLRGRGGGREERKRFEGLGFSLEFGSQELQTDQVLKQLKYIEMNPFFAAAVAPLATTTPSTLIHHQTPNPPQPRIASPPLAQRHQSPPPPAASPQSSPIFPAASRTTFCFTTSNIIPGRHRRLEYGRRSCRRILDLSQKLGEDADEAMRFSLLFG
ncbi:hypothetical protein Droror1_Dr00014058 [Drosera rotundifolia]